MKAMKPSLDWLCNPEIFQVNRIPAHSDHKYTIYGEEPRQSLNGEWRFSYAERPKKRNTKIFSPEYPIETLDTIKVPGHIQLQGYGNPQYVNVMYPWDGNYQVEAPNVPMEVNPVGSYVRDVVIDKRLLAGSRQYISFQGVEQAFYLYVNGKFVGYSEDSFTPSEFDITEFLADGINRIGVEVYKWSSAAWLEDQDFFRFSGIFRDVFLYAVPKVHIRDLFIHTDLTEDYKDCSFSVDVDLSIAENESLEEYRVTLILKDASGNEVLKLENKRAQEVFNHAFFVKDVHLWSAENPYLYNCEICIYESSDSENPINNKIEKAVTINEETEGESRIIRQTEETAKRGREVEKIIQKAGMRRFELKDKIMLINGKRIEFNGVNRHEFHFKNGRAISEKDMVFDIQFFKKHNINAVRTSHYPNQTRWYELCDEYGIYMIGETNMETHGTWSYFGKDPLKTCIPGDKPEWKQVVLDRANSMVQRDKNHPSVLIWSCGNESFGGSNIFEMTKLMKKLDSSRLIHYEGIFWDRRYPDTSDMESRMYERIWNIEEYLNHHPDKPFIGCEYIHAMGNACGNIKDYTDLLDKYPMYQGSFIWDFIDQALVRTREDGTEILGYGGDFDEVPDDGNFCGDGIIFANRTTSAKAQEVKFVYQQVILKPDKKGIFIRNKRLFEDTSDLILKVELLRDGYVIKKWSMEAVVQPLGEKYFDLDIEKYMDLPGEYFVQAVFALKEQTKWAEAGYELMTGRSRAYQVTSENRGINENEEIGENRGINENGEIYGNQIISKNKGNEGIKLNTFKTQNISVVFGNQNVGVHGMPMDVAGNGVSGGAWFDYDFSRKMGGLISVRHFGREMLAGKPEVRFYRAATDNDKGSKFMFDSGIWQFAQRQQSCVEYQCDAGEDMLSVRYIYELPISQDGRIMVSDKRETNSKQPDRGNRLQGVRVETNFTVTPDAAIHVEIVYPGAKNLPEFPLFGMEFPLKKEFEWFSYYGIGPMENYNDRNNGGKIGIFEDTVTNNYSPYLKPQSCGNRTETRWVALTDGKHKITFKAGKGQAPFQFTALHYNEIELDTAPHKEDLPNPYCTYVKIMPVQMGVGGDDSWGSQVREKFRINPENEIRYSFDIIVE